jgi:hypothetical protein
LRRFIHSFLVITLAAAAAACDEKLSSIAGPDTPNLEPTFTSIQRDIFAARGATGRPACVSCHTTTGRATPAGLLNLDGGPEVYDRLVGVAARLKSGETLIIPNNPDTSYLVRKVEGGPNINGGRMPFNGPYLTAGQISILRRWIAIGAPRN